MVFGVYGSPALVVIQCHCYRCDDVVVRASASQSVDLRFISQVESHQKT